MLKMVRYKNREQWLKARKRFIGGSDVSCILGLNPYKTNVQLYREKKGLVEPDDLSDNPLVAYGTQAEEHIRALFALDHQELKIEYVPNNSWHNTDYPFAAASLDGWLEDKDGRKGILEIKTATITSAQQANKWKDEHIPDNYYCQILFYLGVTNWDFVFLRANLKYEKPDSPLYVATKEYYVNRSEVEADIELVMSKAKEFHDCLKNGVKPPLTLTL